MCNETCVGILEAAGWGFVLFLIALFLTAFMGAVVTVFAEKKGKKDG